jgi:NitT/TauT family transport system substrate-binding protein
MMPRPTRRLVLALIASATAMAPFTVLAQTKVRFTLDWRFEGPAAPFTVALDKGYFKAEGLDVSIDAGNGSRESIPRVASGSYDIGVGDINSLIRFRDENPGVDVKAVAIVYDRPPFAIVGRKSRGISNDIKSLEGKKFGAPAADGAFAQWPILRSVAKLDESKMKLENVGFPVREPMLVAGEVDAVFGFAFSVVLNLKSRGVPADDIVTLLMADHGVELYGNAILVSPKFRTENPNAVRGFLRALVKGVRDSLKDPAGAVDSVIKRNDVAKKDVEVERLKMALAQNFVTPWVKANGFGGIDKDRFQRAIDQIGLTFTYKQKPSVATIYDDTIMPAPADRKVD